MIGISTGGPGTLEEILPKIPADFPAPVLVAQHMPGRFTEVFAQRLNGLCDAEVVHVGKPTALQPGCIYIAKGDADMVVANRAGKRMVIPLPEGKHLWHPSVEQLMETAMQHFAPTNIVGVLLTGMGYDGAEAMAKLKQSGGKTIAESEETAVVYGMPRELVERNGQPKYYRIIKWQNR